MLDLSNSDQLAQAIALIRELEETQSLDDEVIRVLQKKFALPDGSMLSKPNLILLYKRLAGKHGLKSFDKRVVTRLRMKPVRTASGVATVTVLTKPFFCPGNCIFCPNDVRMPKSYIASEPGAQRAEHNFFDPYLQTYNRLQALHDMGHKVDKVEVLVLGGSWSVYPLPYKLWFIKEIFRALNEFGQTDSRDEVSGFYRDVMKRVSKEDITYLSSDNEENEQKFAKHQPDGLQTEENAYNQRVSELFQATETELGITEYQTTSWEELLQQQRVNEMANSRCVGLVLETRPDLVNKNEVRQLRQFGATKIQLGVQSLDNEVLQKNKRGHTVEETASAIVLLRQAGFKLHLHWMANLYGSSVKQDKQDFLKLFQDERFRPDELKIYPCSLVETAPLMQYFQKGVWKPYDHDELLEVLSFCLLNTPEYCRISRVIRDIPSFEIFAGNKKSNFRQIAQQHLEKQEQVPQDIRAREIRQEQFDPDQIRLDQVEYGTSSSREFFLQYVVEVAGTKRLLGFLRLSLPLQKDEAIFSELTDAAIIREVHVYGQVVGLGQDAEGRAQHLGLGSKLVEKAKEIAAAEGYAKLAVISAVGTREYYRERGFKDEGLYQVAKS